MNWTELLKAEAESTFRVTEGLLDMIDDSTLDWKPATGSNWMTVGQILMHLSTACGFCCRGFVTGDWEIPGGAKLEEMTPEDMMPPAEKMMTVDSVAQAKELVAADKQLTFDMIDQAGEEDLTSRKVTAPWNPTEQVILGQRLLHMIDHLAVHKAQLFYYLKLQGKPVNTGHLWGM